MPLDASSSSPGQGTAPTWLTWRGYDRRHRKRAASKTAGVLVRGSPGFEIVPEIKVRPSDVIIDKTANGAFTYTELEPVLRAQGITHLLFTGCTTDVCVHSTLREANDRYFECLLIEDACASGDAYAHAAAVHMVTVEGGIFGAVATAEAVVAGLAPGPCKASGCMIRVGDHNIAGAAMNDAIRRNRNGSSTARSKPTDTCSSSPSIGPR